MIRKNFLLICFVYCIFLFPTLVDAASVNARAFSRGENIQLLSLTNPTNAYILYDLTSGEMLGGAQATPEDLTRLVFISIGGNVIEFPKADHTYAVLEVTVDGVCESVPDSYAECKTRPEFVNEFIFTVSAARAGSTGSPVFPMSDEEKILEIAKLQGEIQKLQKELAGLLERQTAASDRASSIGVSETFASDSFRFSLWMKRGSVGDEVKKLQEFLSRDAEIYPEREITGYFGALTEKAVQRFQAKYGIVSSGDPDSTGYGFVGPKTLSALNKLLNQ